MDESVMVRGSMMRIRIPSPLYSEAKPGDSIRAYSTSNGLMKIIDHWVLHVGFTVALGKAKTMLGLALR